MPLVAIVVPLRCAARCRRRAACRPDAPNHRRCAARRRRRAARPVVLPLVALLPLAVVVPHVFVPPVTVVVLPVAVLGCAFCFVFWFLPGLIFRNPWLPRNPRNTRRN
jgi:hypothetical protein